MKLHEIEKIEHFFKDNLNEFKDGKKFTNINWRKYCDNWFVKHYGEPMGMRKITQIIGNCARANGFYFFTSVVMYDSGNYFNHCIFTKYPYRPYLDVDNSESRDEYKEQRRTELQWQRNKNGGLTDKQLRKQINAKQ